MVYASLEGKIKEGKKSIRHIASTTSILASCLFMNSCNMSDQTKLDDSRYRTFKLYYSKNLDNNDKENIWNEILTQIKSDPNGRGSCKEIYAGLNGNINLRLSFSLCEGTEKFWEVAGVSYEGLYVRMNHQSQIYMNPYPYEWILRIKDELIKLYDPYQDGLNMNEVILKPKGSEHSI